MKIRTQDINGHGMLRLKLIKFFRHDNKEALISRHNASIRVLDGENKEHFFRELKDAITFLFDQNYHIDLNI